jgi:hypothetical protein
MIDRPAARQSHAPHAFAPATNEFVEEGSL